MNVKSGGQVSLRWSGSHMWLPAHPHVHVVTCTPTRTCGYLHAHTYMWLPAHPHVVTCTPTRTCGYLRTHTYMWLPAHPHVHVVTCAPTRTCGYLRTHTYMWLLRTHTYMWLPAHPHVHVGTAHPHVHVGTAHPHVHVVTAHPHVHVVTCTPTRTLHWALYCMCENFNTSSVRGFTYSVVRDYLIWKKYISMRKYNRTMAVCHAILTTVLRHLSQG